jgi:protease-4
MSTKKVILIVFIVLVILLALSFWTGRQMSKLNFGSSPTTIISSGSWLHVNPSAYIPEYSEILPFNFLGSKEMNSMQGMTEKIRAAKDDKRITGILLEPSGVQLSLATLNELGIALQDFKKSGKPVVAFGDMMMQGDYLLASFADEIYMEPSASAGLLLSGAAINITFYKELFDKIGVKMHVIQSGEFKGAGEPYSQTSLSEGTRANLAEAILDRFNLIIAGIAERRELTTDDVLAVFNKREDFFMNATQAEQLRLIDKAESRSGLLQKHNIDDDKLVTISSYSARQEAYKGDLIAVVYLEGEIMGGTGSFNQSPISHSKVKRAVKNIEENSDVKAVVVRVNSPGGSALESEYIYQELSRLNQKIPVVISMGGTAASGGYYISCAGQYVVADPGTITGSIGVIMMLPEATGLGKKVGLRSQTIKYGKFAGAINPLEPYPAELLASLSRNSTGTYNEFKARVMTAREISPDKINSIAEGRIFSAEDALALNLVDELGSLDVAIAKAGELAGITSYRARNFPRKKSILEILKETDFMNMQVSSLLKAASGNPEELANYMLENLKPYTWLYLMPLRVD